MIQLQLFNQRQGQWKGISFEEEQVESVLFDYNALKKRVLKQLNYSMADKNRIELCFQGVYKELPSLVTPIQTQENLLYLFKFMLDNRPSLLLNNQYVVKLRMQPLRELREKVKRSKETVVEFDSDGSVDSFDDNKFANIIPSKGRYVSQDAVRCAFCHQSSQNSHANRKLGAFYGPFGKGNYVHLLCSIWCSEVHLDQYDNSLKDVQLQIKNSQKTKCRVCKKGGAGSRCHDPFRRCNYYVHYECGQRDGCDFNWNLYVFLCPRCKSNSIKRSKLKWQLQNNNTQQEQAFNISEAKYNEKHNAIDLQDSK